MSNFDPNAILRGVQLTVVGGAFPSIYLIYQHEQHHQKIRALLTGERGRDSTPRSVESEPLQA